jgi:adenylate cyclase
VVRAFQTALFDTLAQAIARYDGFVEKFVGDAVMAVFGAPVAHEDDPQRAVGRGAGHAGARRRRSAGSGSGGLGQPVTLHIGLHTGPVVAGSLGGGTEAAYAVTGTR